MIAQILVIDSDPIQRRLLKSALEGYDHVVHMAENGRAGLEFLRLHGDQINVIVLDMMMPGTEGESLLTAIQGTGVTAPVIVQTGQAEGDALVRAMQAGAFDFVVKPVSPERIAGSVVNALKLEQKDGRGRGTRKGRAGTVQFGDIVSASADMMRVIDLAQRAALSPIPVVLEGETGVGKELVARAIQCSSDRAGKPFVTVNCGAIAADLIESVLFGDEKGSGGSQPGKFAEADGGTLFLDEIGNLPLDVQVKLLRAVQFGEIEAVGSDAVRNVDVRLISATNKDLIEEVREKRFREDLYYRLNVFPITIPALRRRKEDIPHLARVFAQRFSTEQHLARPVTVGPAALALLTAHDWPGNVRELENALFRAVVLAQDEQLTEADFPQIAAQLPHFPNAELKAGAAPVRTVARAVSPADERREAVASELSHRLADGFLGRPAGPSRPDPRALLAAAYPASDNVIPTTDGTGDVRKLADVEEELIRFALKFYRGQMSQVARKLGIGRSTLYRKLKDYGIDPDNPLKEAA
ncbi:sigma-54-dependent transcriptional regulator [Pseudorhizobium pelagicum]|uniref:DNA-binding transcriptional regulator NtrC n=1 Tax=Pseudorhizobium pelagicum TaxID=1509405 RepID=A0A922TBN5_9HYPH|nr:sigma-54 dependent transcriptional regulator [Pseudorhizobium pelagicum]KEQ06596.1 Fis family transcriptional regulator [Pseudorhizobium pelagicum]KEQ09752.1 Fis family transcriptional regulator [Pseudorhizobium pelagicum]